MDSSSTRDDSIQQHPADLAFYRKSVVLQFALKQASRSERKVSQRGGKEYYATEEGCLHLTMAKRPKDGAPFDFANKIVLTFNVSEVGKLKIALQGKETVTIEHNANQGRSEEKDMKKLIMEPVPDKKQIKFAMFRDNNGQQSQCVFFMDRNEAAIMLDLIPTVAARILAW